MQFGKGAHKGRSQRQSSPLGHPGRQEAVLHEHSAALTELSKVDRMPDKNLLSGQLMNIAVGLTGKNYMQKKTEVVALCAALQSRDPIELMLDRSLVAANITTMDRFARATMASNPRAREINLRYGMKGVQVQLDVVKVREARRGQVDQKVVVGNVNVEAGGQAIVGHVNAKKRRKRKPKSSSVSRPTVK